MAATFKNAKAVLAMATSDVYVVPSGTTSIVIGCQVTNVAIVPDDLSFWWTDSSDSDAATYLADEIEIPVNASYEPIGGKLVLEAGDKIQGSTVVADNSLEVTLSILELS